MDFVSIAGFLGGWRSCVEIALLAVLIYCVLYFLRGSRGAMVLAGLVFVLIGLSWLSSQLHFQVIGKLIHESPVILALAIIVVFQPELRRAFAQLGSFTLLRGRKRREIIGEVVAAAVNMSRRKCGALIVLERRIGTRALEEDAVKLDLRVNSLVIESIFYPNSPLHDGAIIIRDDRIVAARVILPLTRNGGLLSKRLGTRHRAAVGVSEETDAVVVVVSEETGIISICTGGILKRDLPVEQLEDALEELMQARHSGNVFLTADGETDGHSMEDLQ